MTTLTPKLQKFHDYFLSKQQEIIKTSANRASDTIDAGGDEGDIASANAIKLLSDQLSKRELDTLRAIERCLYRINESSYDICEECEEEISENRLSAIPYTTLCISCAEEQELQAKIG
jgi:DnaK suppressor protein